MKTRWCQVYFVELSHENDRSNFVVSACASKRGGRSDGTLLMSKTLHALLKATASKMSDA